MSVRITGPWCIECQQRPARTHGLCTNCDRMLALWGPRGLERMTITSVNDPGFEAELHAWRTGDNPS